MNSQKSEKEFLRQYSSELFSSPLSTVDVSIFTIIDNKLNVLLIKRPQYPEKGKWALPGGFIDLVNDKNIEDSAKRKLSEKTGITTSHLEQVETIGNQKRDPRGWSITIIYMALISFGEIEHNIEENSETIKWVPINDLQSYEDIAFDHNEILTLCLDRLRSKVQYTSIPVNLLPPTFTLSELQKTFELVLGNKFEKKSFRRRVLDAEILEETDLQRKGSNRPAKLYAAKKDGRNHFFSRNMVGV
jgi:ADP-ribose pyrophosphatase YjhB (NUDIX family)